MTLGGRGIGEPDGGAALGAAQLAGVGRVSASSADGETPRATGRGAPRIDGGNVWRVAERFAVRLVVSVRALPLVRAVSPWRG